MEKLGHIYAYFFSSEKYVIFQMAQVMPTLIEAYDK